VPAVRPELRLARRRRSRRGTLATALLAALLGGAVALPAAAAAALAPPAAAPAPPAAAPAPPVAAPAPAAGTLSLTPVPVLTCTVTLPDDTFQAVFGYVNNGVQIVVPAGLLNDVYPDSTDGSQPTVFKHGTYQTAVVTSPVAKNRKATWQLLGMYASAGWKQSPCGPDVTLPTEGNGIGPVLVLVLSIALSSAVGAIRGRRRRRRSA